MKEKKITKLVKKVSKVYELNKIENDNLNNYIMKYIKENGYNIDNKNINYLLEKTGLNLSNIINELDKMFIYKDVNKDITKEDIKELITTNIEENIFSLTNALVDNKKDKLIKIYNNLIKLNEDPIKLIVTISNQLRLILEVKIMVENGYRDNEIISKLKEHPYRIKLAKNSKISINILKQKLKELSILNYNIVTGKIDKYFGLEMFLLSY